MPAGSPQQPTLLARVKARLLEELKRFDDAKGAGADEYCTHAISHAMAEGRFLSTIGLLHETGVLSNALATRYGQASAQRLKELGGARADGMAWGLGFEWSGCSAHEPFVITTCLVVDGLEQAGSICGRLGAKLLNEGQAWLAAAPSDFGVEIAPGLRVPSFSPEIGTTPWNVVASWARTVGDGLSNRDDVLQFVLGKRMAGIGWPYDATSARIDLLHQCYILDALRDHVGADAAATLTLRTLSVFATRDGWLDKVDVVSDEGAETFFGAPGVQILPLGNGTRFIGHPNAARDWSLGEALFVAARTTGDVLAAKALGRISSRLAEEILRRFDEGEVAYHPRAVMHLCRGLASLLAARRSARDLAATAEAEH